MLYQVVSKISSKPRKGQAECVFFTEKDAQQAIDYYGDPSYFIQRYELAESYRNVVHTTIKKEKVCL